jgi:hypothetical protein
MHAGTPSTRKPGGPWIAWRGCAKPQRQGYGRNPLMHGPGKSDPPIVPGKRPNRPGRPGAEAVEGRGGAKGTAGRQSTGRTQSRETVSQALACVREAAKRNRNERFTSLMHHVTPELLAWAFHQLKARAAPGVDGVTWEEYAGTLDGNIGDLHRRVMRGGYRAKPSRRQYIPKADGRQRPLGIAALEDKIVQTGAGGGAERDLRDGLPRLLLRVPTGALPARCAGCARLRDHPAAGELGPRRRHPGVLRLHQPRVDDAVPGAPDRRPPCAPADSQMAEGRGHGGGGVDGEHGGDAPGRGDLAAPGEHLPALRLRPLGGPVAQARGDRRGDRRPLRRRYHRRLQAAGGCRAVSPRSAGAAGEVRPGAAPRQDPPDRVRPLSRPSTGRRGGWGNRRPSISSASRTSAGSRRKEDGSLWCGTPSPSGCEPNSSRSRRR